MKEQKSLLQQIRGVVSLSFADGCYLSNNAHSLHINSPSLAIMMSKEETHIDCEMHSRLKRGGGGRQNVTSCCTGGNGLLLLK